jgi:2-hydroxychromene-2-carboxylate isomerase
MTAAKTVEFWFDVGSPASWLAWTQLEPLAAATGATVLHRPMLLGGVFQATGNHSPAQIPAKGRYMHDDFARFAARHGVPYRHNPHFPINTLALMRGAVAMQLQAPERFVPYVDAVFRAIWVDGRNLNDAAEVAAALQASGFDPAWLLALAQQPEVKERLKALTQEAVERGVFGAPTFFVGPAMYWGQDRLDFVKEALQ